MSEQAVELRDQFADTYDTDPPVPVESSQPVANYVVDEDAIPDDLVADEHVAEVNGLTVMRAGIECPQCGSNVFLHPESISPTNSVYCFNCSHSPLGVVWWETPRLEAYADGGGSR